jgi:ABC-2 type transport system ATP-binding protein
VDLLEVQGLHKSFKESLISTRHHVLKGLDFILKEGSITGFLGANGAGKTTLIKILLGFISSDEGEINWSSHLGRDHKDVLRHIGYFPERPYFYPNVTGREFLIYTGKLSGVELKRLLNQIEKFSQILKIDHALDRKIRGYSKGMLQRLGFISAIAHDPKFLIFDEPLSGLDPIGRQEFKDVLKSLHNEGKTIFFSSHIVPDIEEVCDDVLFLDQGKIVFHGAIEKLLEEHSTRKYRVRYRQEGGERLFETSYYEELFFIMSDKKIEIITVEKKRPRLEEIIYQSEHRGIDE